MPPKHVEKINITRNNKKNVYGHIILYFLYLICKFVNKTVLRTIYIRERGIKTHK